MSVGNFSVVISPLSNARSVVVEGNITERLNDLSYTISAEGGYDTAKMSLNIRDVELEQWLADSIMSVVTIRSPYGDIVWEGFINTVEINYGGLAYSLGPITDIGNRVSVVYTPILDATQTPPLTGSSTTTVIVEDTVSQGKYLIWDKVIGSGTVTDEVAESLRDTWLSENKSPKLKSSYTKFGENAPAVVLSCLGWYHILKYYIYNQTASASSVTISTKLQSILTADPNSIFSTDYSGITSNGLLTTSYEDRNKDALSLIKEIVSYGDVNDNRYVFGVYADKKVVYSAVPTTYQYIEDLRAKDLSIQDIGFGKIQPWQVLPGKFVRYIGLLTAQPLATPFYEDPRIMFIEKVEVVAPADIKLSGSPISTFEQRVAKLGIE